MKLSQSVTKLTYWIKPLLVLALTALLASGCKSEMTGPSGGAGMPPPPSGGGMPTPPSPPSGGGQSGGGQSGGGQSGGGQSGGEQSGGESGGMPGGGMPGGSDSGATGSSGDAGDGSSGEVGSFPSEDPMGVPPMPDSGGGGAGEEANSAGDEAENDGDGDASGDCGDTGSLPGGVGGMGQAGECIGGASASASNSEAESGGSTGTGGAGSVGQFPQESAAQRAARLGKELDEAVGGFDEVLMEEQREIASVGRNTEGFGSGAAGSGGSVSLGQQTAGARGSIIVANTGSRRESPIDAMSQEEISERTPQDVPIMVDDDIIARQLREAALVEEDPQLRDRLWEEYRKYKGL